MHRRAPIATLALAALVVVPTLSLATIAQRAKSATSPELKAQLGALGKSAKRLSTTQKGAVSSRLASDTRDVRIDASGQSLFTNAATDQSQVVAYFATQKLSNLMVALQIIDKPIPVFIKDLRFVASLYENTGLEKVANETADNMEKGPYDAEKAKKNVDLMLAGIAHAAEKSGPEATFHYSSGFNVGVTTMVSNLLEFDDLDMKKAGRALLKSNMESAQKLAAETPGDVDSDVKATFTAYSQAKITDTDSASAAIDPLNKVYLEKLK